MSTSQNETPNESSFRSGWTAAKVPAKLRAASLHFAASFLIAACITIPMIVWLYPNPFFQAAGGLHLLGMILAVDVVIGPALTFLVFELGKPSTRSDLTTIVLMQTLALVYGLYVTALSRPVFMTYVVDRYELVSAADVDDAEFLKAPENLKLPRWGHPEQAYAEQPNSLEERSSILLSSLNGVDLSRMFRYYKSAQLARPEIIKRAKPISDLIALNGDMAVQKAIKPFDDRPLAYVPLQGKKRDLTVLVDAQTGELIKVVALTPWSDKKLID